MLPDGRGVGGGGVFGAGLSSQRGFPYTSSTVCQHTAPHAADDTIAAAFSLAPAPPFLVCFNEERGARGKSAISIP